MIITIDMNNDNIHISDKELGEFQQKGETIHTKIRNPDRISILLQEILSRIVIDRMHLNVPGLSIRIDVIDEDTRTTAGDYLL